MRFKLLAVALLAIAPMAVRAQKINKDEPVPEKVAVLPWINQKGTDGAVKTGKEFLDTILTKLQMEVIPEARVTMAWTKSLDHADDEERTELPTPKDLLKLGEKLGVDWVITGRAVWHTKSIWIGLGPKTKSDCTVDMLIIDVKKQEIALNAKQVRMDSTAKEDTAKAAGTILLTPLFTAVSGGPKTPHEQRAVQLAINKAIQPWLAARPQVKKIETDDKAIK